MACLAGICGTEEQRHARRVAAEKENELRSQMRELKGKLDAIREEVEAARSQREDMETEVAEKEESKMKMQAQIKAREAIAAKHKQTAKASERRLFYFLDTPAARKATKEKELQWQLDTLTNDLDALDLAAGAEEGDETSLAKELREEKHRSEALRKELAATLPEEEDDEETEQESFTHKQLNTFRGQTPAVQRMMKSSISDLISELSAAQNELKLEKRMIDQTASEAAQYDQEMEALARKMGNGLYASLQTPRGKKWFRAQTPERQRAIKNELASTLQEMEGAEVDKQLSQIRADTTQRKLSMMRDRSAAMEKSLMDNGRAPSFAYTAGVGA